jgi:hypothetical protein
MSSRNAKVITEGNVITTVIQDKKFDGDPLYPYFKKASKYRIDPDKANTLFLKYMAFYAALLGSLSEDNRITTDTLKKIGADYNLSKNTIEHCITDLIYAGELIKVKRGLFMLNPEHISTGTSQQESRDLIAKAKDIIQNQNNIQNQHITINIGDNPPKNLSLADILINKQFNDLNK